jgi:hypothetical protein
MGGVKGAIASIQKLTQDKETGFLDVFIGTQKPGFFRNISVIHKKRSHKPGFSVCL